MSIYETNKNQNGLLHKSDLQSNKLKPWITSYVTCKQPFLW